MLLYYSKISIIFPILSEFSQSLLEFPESFSCICRGGSCYHLVININLRLFLSFVRQSLYSISFNVTLFLNPGWNWKLYRLCLSDSKAELLDALITNCPSPGLMVDSIIFPPSWPSSAIFAILIWICSASSGFFK